MITTRYANINDTPGILPLLEQLGYPTNIEGLRLKFNDFIQNPGYGVAIAEENSRIIGFVAWSMSKLFVLDKVRFHIEGIATHEKYRGKGIGRKLMEFVERIAFEHSPAIIDLTSGIRRAKEGTHEFYKKLGYKNEGHMAKLYLRKEL